MSGQPARSEASRDHPCLVTGLLSFMRVISSGGPHRMRSWQWVELGFEEDEGGEIGSIGSELSLPIARNLCFHSEKNYPPDCLWHQLGSFGSTPSHLQNLEPLSGRVKGPNTHPIGGVTQGLSADDKWIMVTDLGRWPPVLNCYSEKSCYNGLRCAQKVQHRSIKDIPQWAKKFPLKLPMMVDSTKIRLHLFKIWFFKIRCSAK